MPIQKPIAARERIQRIKTRTWTLRFWIKPMPFVRRGGIDSLLADFVPFLNLRRAMTVPAVEAALLEFFEDDDGIAAVEVLSNTTLNGIVIYLEWP